MSEQIEIEYTAHDGSLVQVDIPLDRCVPVSGGGVAWYGDTRSSLSPDDHRELVKDQLAFVRARQAQLKEEMLDFLIEHLDPDVLERLTSDDPLVVLDALTDWEDE